MIERAVFSYFNADESFGNNCGFASYRDFLTSTALSLLLAKKHFKEVQMISTNWGNDLFQNLEFPITEYSNKLENIRYIPPAFWAYGKLVAYTEQPKPFVHLDNDVFLWDPLPQRILDARLCFQSQEPFNQRGYHYYNILKYCWEDAVVRPEKIDNNEVFDFAYNCGICGGWDLYFFKEWRELSAQYIFALENQELFFEKWAPILKHQNLFHEQYFAACLIQAYKLRDQVEILAPVAMDIPKTYKYSHIWGTTKTEGKWIAGIRQKLFQMDRHLYKKVEMFCIDRGL
jgi:hypothetical protein